MVAPIRMEIKGADLDLDAVIEGIIILDKIIADNHFQFGEAWDSFLPLEEGEVDDGVGRMAYVPEVAIRKCFPMNDEFQGKVRDIPYYLLVLNSARDLRPKSSDKEETPSHCKLCKNVIDKRMIISEIDDFYVTPNGFPYHEGASLLINKSLEREQGSLTVEDIATWMKASILLNQYVFYNAPLAGASIMEHQHVQMVDPSKIKVDNEVVPYPILNKSFVDREKVNGREDVSRLKNYAVDGLVFSGRDAPHNAKYAVSLLETEGRSYNVLVNKDEVIVVGRNKEKEKSICIRRNVGGYEISGLALLGNVEEVNGSLEIRVSGDKIFSNMTHGIFGKNLRGSSTPMDEVVTRFE